MSLKNAENTKNKLMDILEEELSALQLKEIDKCKEKENAKQNYQNDDEDADNESFSSSSDTTADKEDENNQHVEKYKINETLNPLSKNVVKETQPPMKHNNQEREFIHQENAVIEENKKSVEELESKMHGKKIYRDNEENFSPPPDSLAEKIRERAEFYFEDYNLFKNSYLLSHIGRNKNGYVNLRVLCSLRKIKSLTRDSRVVAYSLKDSNVLELSPEENRIRRIEPIPKTEDTNFGKTLMVFNLPSQNLSPDSLQEMFSKFGTVVSAGVYEIDSPASDMYHERCLNFHHRIASKVYGLVEFENYDEVVRALKDEDGHLPKENEVIAVPLLPQIYKKEKRHLKFLRPYYPNPRRGYDRYRPRNDYYRETSSSRDVMRNEKMNRRGGYNNQRGYFWRPYRSKKPFMASNTKSFADDYLPREPRERNQPIRGKSFGDDYVPRERNQPMRGMPKKWGENRQLRTNNSFNIDRLYPNTQRRKAGNGYMNHGVVA